MNYKKLLQDPRWQKKRLKIMERDNFTCHDTGATDEQLHVHHCWYAKGSPWETPDEFLLTLSNDAHQHRQGLEQRAKKALGLIMAKTPCEGPGYADRLGELVESMEAMALKDPKEDTIMPTMLNYVVYEDLLHFFYKACGPSFENVDSVLKSANFMDETEIALGLPIKKGAK